MRTAALLAALLLVGCIASPADDPDSEAPVPSVRTSVDAVPSRVRPIGDGWDDVQAAGGLPTVPRRPNVTIPPPRLIVAVPTGGSPRLPGAGRATGTASWYCGHGSPCTRGHPSGLYAAAGSALRVGDWRGRTVQVAANGRLLRVVLIDTCACPNGRLLDLYSDAFEQLAPLSKGLVTVEVTWQ